MSRQLQFIERVRSYARWANLTMVATAVPLVAWSTGWVALEQPAWLALPVALGTPLLIYQRRNLCCPKCERYLERGELRGECPECGQSLLP